MRRKKEGTALGCSVSYSEDKWSAYTKPDSLPGFRFDHPKFTRLPRRSHLMYTNRWNLYKAQRLKAEPLCPFAKLRIYFTASIEPTVSGWWRAKARPNFGAQLPRDSPNPCSGSCLSHWQGLSRLLSAKSDLAIGWISSRASHHCLLLCVALWHMMITTADVSWISGKSRNPTWIKIRWTC